MSSIKRQSLNNKEELTLNSRVLVNNELAGTIKYIGTTSFQTGKWVGVELDEPEGKNSGVVQGKRYFECKTNHGVFTRPANVKIIESTKTSPRKKSMVPQRKSAVPERRKSIVERRKSIVEPPIIPQPQHRPKSIIEQRKSVVPERRKSIVSKRDSSSPSLRKTVTPTLTKSTIRTSPSTIRTSQSTIRTSQSTLRRPIAIIKGPITAPSTPEDEDDNDDNESDFDTMYSDNTMTNATTIASPISIEKDDEEQSDEEEQSIESDEENEEEEPQLVEDESLSEEDKNEEQLSEDELLEEEIEQVKVEESGPQPVYGSLASTKPISKSEQTVPLKDYEELRFKLKILEIKRNEDRERFREHEKIKEEAEQFLTLRNKLQDKISELQKDVREARRELKQVSSEKETYESKYNDLLESMEMLTLDKEVAEERADSLQQETEILKDKIEEISIDLDILKQEADILNKLPAQRDQEDNERIPLEVVQLERHNERLKEALVRLRDVTTENEAELNLRIKTLEQENYELEELRYQYEKVKEQLMTAEILVEDLKMQLDDAVGTEDLVEQLTEKNLNLTEKMEELKATVDDLEALKELADELEENHVETERQLQAEIDHRDMLLREQVERLRANEETIADYETTIEQFRQLVSHLQNDLKELKRKEKDDQTEKMTLSSQSQAMMSLNLQLQTTVMKAQAKSIDIELRKLEASQANDRLNMIQPYLPEPFFKTENDPISCLLLFKRLEFKSDLIIKHLDQNYPVSEKIMDSVTENLIIICEIKQRAGWLSSLSARFQTYVKNCEPNTFAEMGKVYLDLIGVERKMNGIVELFRTDQMNEAYCLTELQRIISQVEHLVEANLSEQQEKSNADQFFGLTKALDLNADRMIVIFTFARQLLDNSVKKDGLVIDEGVGQMEQDYMEPLGRLITQAKNSKIIAKKLMRQLEDKFEEAMTLKADYLNRFKMLYSISKKLCRFCFDVYKELVSYVDAKRGSHEPLELSFIKKLLREKGDEIFEMAESSMWESSLRTLKTLTNELETTHSQVEYDDKLDKITTKVAPWIQRASDIKAEVVVNHELEHKLQQHNEEIIKLIKDIKLKDQSLQEADVKINLLEKRMEVAKKEIEHVKRLEEDLEKSVNQEQLYAETMESLQNENDALEAEINQLKKEANRREEKRQSLIRKAATFDLTEHEDTTTMQEMAGNYYEMSGQMEALKNSIRYLRAENTELKKLDFIRSLRLDLVEPTKEFTVDDRLKSIARETRVLVKDLRSAGASPRVIQLSDYKNNSQSGKKLPDYQYQTQQSVLYTLKQRSEQLRDQIKSQLQFTQKKEPSESTQMLGLVKIPILQDTTNTASRHCVHLKSAIEFEKLHRVFIQS
ncbi:hypothetical protein G6F46_004117 [Rhizopus delemar]|uniref:CAP-Gly domain-containing protein n=2 Tax=Rhizopus TaxID=4842 RepID=A0A9P6Z684_9FUNG|nr:hypothetical protein G6F55_003688 [Rhizopus delemar]KAG1547503.1 hypothetical protein G6F51_004235 [Rhizopus arrhizus]KAG1503271.1 hypothetical protein G6F54_001786 [Rhizopus delemar]KAG1514463.1 hypothetical protein G6F53_003660 [Rhizopus delemar]KAG1521730.1 hypothetical protein G6F52_006478 [Rhizopus delemar]